MADKAEIQKWLAARAEQDERLYQRYGQALEPQHQGEFLAISPDGHLIRGSDELTVAQEAIAHFGPGNFALRRIGMEAEIRWRRPLV